MTGYGRCRPLLARRISDRLTRAESLSSALRAARGCCARFPPRGCGVAAPAVSHSWIPGLARPAGLASAGDAACPCCGLGCARSMCVLRRETGLCSKVEN